ncbi:hypothetical protein QRO11_15330 [Paracidovorax citrulli]|uniref:Uncharacterized protein n=2 Tax=Paracidovorax citrulli TaxID=80869 RepID=A1TMW1_PARC0|nr:hypothetical protein [Paracidovorax citrulli]ABM32299.1 hypothetical protein Aave_1712 [Paracidovorax citrulli AAC00-1]ATG94689.1 hypothetical protein CQB05_12165 [Paracidovorax citrulli]MVT30164.1 hypothetical protein [Paracidovorax citrulli]MVT38571.1 hypothetical protein [Paracidovorax citrulli]PVY66499.1 hypothetical protein C8E08_3907 [Paracidovorax citrulli]
MTIRLSSGLRRAIVTNYGLGSMLQYGHIRIYSGSQPRTADEAPPGVLLAIVSADGVTPVPGTPTGGLGVAGGDDPGALVKAGNWVIRGVANGIPGWWRFVGGAERDPDTFSDYFPRMDGAVGESLLLGMDSITTDTNRAVALFNLVLPAE